MDTRTRGRAGSGRGTRRIRRRTAVALATVLAGGVLLPLAPYAAAHPVYPSAHQVARSRQAVRAKAGEGGRLFGSVTAQDIAEAIARKGIEISKKQIDLPEPIKAAGFYRVPVHLHPKTSAMVEVNVVGTT